MKTNIKVLVPRNGWQESRTRQRETCLKLNLCVKETCL